MYRHDVVIIAPYVLRKNKKKEEARV